MHSQSRFFYRRPSWRQAFCRSIFQPYKYVHDRKYILGSAGTQWSRKFCNDVDQCFKATHRSRQLGLFYATAIEVGYSRIQLTKQITAEATDYAMRPASCRSTINITIAHSEVSERFRARHGTRFESMMHG